MDTMQMSYILALAKENYNITQTAKRLYITQAALSKSLHSVEDKLDVELFIRENGRLTDLSPAGRTFVKYAQQILDTYQIMREEMSRYSGAMSGAVNIGINGDLVDILFYKALSDLIISYPSVQLDFNEETSLELEQLFISNELDILIELDHNQHSRAAYEQATLISQDYGVFMEPGHPLAKNDAITWKQIKDYPLALPIKSYTRMLVLNELMSRNFTPHIAVNATSSRILIRSVLDSQVITILPKLFGNANTEQKDGAVWVPIRDGIKWTVNILMKKRHREENDIVCRIFDSIRQTDFASELPSAGDPSENRF